ncbi:MAG: hypothetical protein AAB540_02690, partial [Patescibacteria group bacterium]
NMENNISKSLYWAPRVLSIIFICFLALMSLDVFGSGLSFWQTVVALFMHNLPALFLLVVLIISWKHEIVGGVGFILAGLAYIALLMRNQFEWYLLLWAIQISGIAFLTGTLFLIGWFKKNKKIQT